MWCISMNRNILSSNNTDIKPRLQVITTLIIALPTVLYRNHLIMKKILSGLLSIFS